LGNAVIKPGEFAASAHNIIRSIARAGDREEEFNYPDILGN
jgi:hypothetical protein